MFSFADWQDPTTLAVLLIGAICFVIYVFIALVALIWSYRIWRSDHGGKRVVIPDA